MTDLRDRIARALSAQTTCDGGPHPSELHFRQADAVLAVLDLDKVRADVFDEGVLAGRNREHHSNMTAEQAERAFPNPYRKAEQ